MFNLSALSVALNGALFEAGDIELVGIRNDFRINTLVIQIGSNIVTSNGSVGSTDAAALPRSSSRPEALGAERTDTPPTGADPRDKMVPPPAQTETAFTIDTTLVFDRLDIVASGDIHLRFLRMMLMTSPTRRLRFGREPVLTLDLSDIPEVIEDSEWTRPDKPRRIAIPKTFYGKSMATRGAKLVSQAVTRDGESRLTIYRLPLSKTVELAGQKYRFESSVFSDVFLAVARKEKGPHPGTRRLLLLARPQSTKP